MKLVLVTSFGIFVLAIEDMPDFASDVVGAENRAAFLSRFDGGREAVVYGGRAEDAE